MRRRKIFAKWTLGRRLNGFQGISLNDRTILFLVILLDKAVSVNFTIIIVCAVDLVSLQHLNHPPNFPD